MRRLLLLILSFTLMGIFNPAAVFATSAAKKIIVIDPGHGGWDPGKVGKNNVLEKDINLAIAEDLQVLLETAGATVFLTRAEDTALGDKKNADLTARANMPADMQADIFISIHQNAFATERAKGAQTFYYGDSEDSHRLAQAIQTRMQEFLNQDNNKTATANSGYFVLKKTQTPAVLVECGFLTNSDDLQKLATENYQEKVAWGIYLGILDYFAY